MKFDSKLTFEDHVRGIVSRVSQRIGSLRLVKRKFVYTSVLLRCYFAMVLPILEYCSPVRGSADECYLQLLELHVYSVGRLCPDKSFLSLCHRRRVAGLKMLYKVNSNCNYCLFSQLPSASMLEFESRELGLQLIHWSLKYQGEEHHNLLGCSQPLVAFLSCVFFFRGKGACGVVTAIYKQLCFPHLGRCCWF